MLNKKNVGKTCLVKRLLNKDLKSIEISTDGIEFHTISTTLQSLSAYSSSISSLPPSTEISINLWDFAGQEVSFFLLISFIFFFC